MDLADDTAATLGHNTPVIEVIHKWENQDVVAIRGWPSSRVLD